MNPPLRRYGAIRTSLFLLIAGLVAQAGAAEAIVSTSTARSASVSSVPAAANTAAPAGSAPPTASLYAELGGSQGVAAITSAFVEIMLGDARVKGAFDGVDLDHLRMRLAEHICSISGGGCAYRGRSMAEAHEDLKLGNAQFNASVENLQAAMDGQGISPRVQNQLLARMAPMQRDIVTK